MSDTAYLSCDDCAHYARVRMRVVAPHIGVKAQRTDQDPADVYDTYMAGVHQRHRAGHPILPGQHRDLRITAGRSAALIAAAYQED